MSDRPEVIAFLAKYAPEIASAILDARTELHKLVPRGYELVYDNYNALVFGFSPSPRATDALVSIAGYPKWVTLFFLKGARLADPDGLLQGTGSTVRSIRLVGKNTLKSKPVVALLRAALAEGVAGFEAAPSLSTVVKSVSAKQRPRQPATEGHSPRRQLSRKGTRGDA